MLQYYDQKVILILRYNDINDQYLELASGVDTDESAHSYRLLSCVFDLFIRTHSRQMISPQFPH